MIRIKMKDGRKTVWEGEAHHIVTVKGIWHFVPFLGALSITTHLVVGSVSVETIPA